VQTNILKYALLNGAGTALYIALLVSAMMAVQNPDSPDPDTALLPMGMLLLFVLSAAITSSLVLGRPILWYIDGRKKEAIQLFLYTLWVLFVVMVTVFISLYLKFYA
jgi:hypothetical protein